MNDNLKSAILANISLVVLIFLCILFVEGIKATSQGNTMSSNQQHKLTEQEIADIAKRHHQPDIHRETRDRLKDLIGDTANVQQQQQNPNPPHKETVETNPNKH